MILPTNQGMCSCVVCASVVHVAMMFVCVCVYVQARVCIHDIAVIVIQVDYSDIKHTCFNYPLGDRPRLVRVKFPPVLSQICDNCPRSVT